MYIEGEGFSNIYKEVCKNLLENGEVVSPRHMPTTEIKGVIIKILNPRTRILNKNVRKISLPFAIGEWLWCMSGRKDLEMIQYYAPSYNKYSDNGIILNGAYGPRIKRNLEKIINLLKSDCDTRRAVIPIYDKADVGLKSNDIPCTLTLQFMIRNNECNDKIKVLENEIENIRTEKRKSDNMEEEVLKLEQLIEDKINFPSDDMIIDLLDKIVVYSSDETHNVKLRIYLKIGEEIIADYKNHKSHQFNVVKAHD